TISTASGPPSRDQGAMTYAPALGKTTNVAFLFGGSASSNELDDSWTWNGTSWHKVTAAGGPDQRYGLGLFYDDARQSVVAFGGGAGPDFLETSETWEYGVLGGACTTSSDCDQYACVDGACCAVDDCGPCSRCSVVTGACEAVTNADDPDSCTGDSTCDQNGA